MKKRALRIGCMVTIFVFAFSLNCMAGIVDEEIKTGNAEQKPEANIANSSEPTVVEVTTTDTQLTSGTQAASGGAASLTPIEEATSIASGLMASGKTDKSVVIATLVSYGYEQTEAEIAYAKASTNNVLDTSLNENKSAENTGAETDTAQTDTASDDPDIEQSAPETSPKDRVAAGVKPGPKFRKGELKQGVLDNFGSRIRNRTQNAYKNEAETVSKMLDEGYTIEQVAEGFAENGYASSAIAKIFKESGVSSSEAYSVISSAEVKKAETEFNNKPKTKFSKRFSGLAKNNETLDDKKQDALKSVVNDLEAAGYDVQEVLDTAVKDLKDSGMSAQEVKDFINTKVADGKPKAKFKGLSNFSKALNTSVNVINGAIKKQTTMTSYGEGEIALATAMINAGYSESEVTKAFENGTQRYTKADAHLIVSGGQYNANHPIGNNNINTNAVNTNNNPETQQDILQRQTQATPI